MKALKPLTAFATLLAVGLTAPIEVDSLENHSPLDRRGIKSCGKNWMAIQDVHTNQDDILRLGYNSAVDFFCEQADSQVVDRDHYLSMATKVWLTERDPKDSGTYGWVYFEVHNKRKGETYMVQVDECKANLKKLSKPDGKCTDERLGVTQGGKWQGKDLPVSYRGIEHHKPPKADAIDKVFIATYKI